MAWFGSKITRDRLLADRLSVGMLIASNLIPLVGVLIFGWTTFEIVALYWFENVVLGVINVLKMLTCAPDPDRIDLPKLISQQPGMKEQTEKALKQAQQLLGSPLAVHGAKLFFVPFFIFHYGLFCFVHGVFVVALLGPGGMAGGAGGMAGGPSLPNPASSFNMLIAAAALAASHGVSLVKNYLIGGEYRRTMLPVLMMQPYARIVVLHLAILGGAFLIVLLGSPMPLLLVLIAGKTLLDLSLHLAEHLSTEAAPDPAQSPSTVSRDRP